MTPPQVQQHQGEDAQPPQQQSNNMQLAILPADHNNNNSNNSNKKQQQPLNPIALMKRSDSGFVGLSNQGATCYLNSLVQALYMTPELRKLVYQWRYNPNVHASPEHCIPLQLQRLFARLQLSEKRAAMTKDLTKSFGWNQSDSFIQHDIQELCRVLMDALDESFEQSEKTSAAAAATTAAEESSTTVVECNNSSKSEEGNNNLKYGRVSDLYKGIMLDYIQVVEPIHHDDSRENDQDGDVPMGDAPVTIDQYKPVLNPQTGKPYGRVREDVYMDIQLVVRDMNSIEESLTAYMKPELLTGDNRWSCEELNDQKVDAKKGLALKTLPYLLSLQLNRFDFDYVTWERIKLANKISFPFYLDMTSFVPPSTDNHTKLYELFAVLIHSGSANGGHYFAYIKSFENGKWYNFNDSSVQEIEQEAVKIMYGGTDGEAGKSLYKNVNASTNAYMLMYRMIDPSKNVVTVPDSLIAEDIRREIEQENELFRAEVKQKEREQEIAKVKVFLPKAKGDYSKIVSFDIELEKNATFEQAKKQIFAKAIEQEEWSERESQIEHARIREYDFLKRCPGKIVRASDDTIISSLGIKNYTSLTIQTKYPDEDWPVETAVMNILLSPLNPETKAFDHLLSKSVRADQTLRELKQELSKILGEKYPAESLNVVTSPGDTVYNQYNAKDEDKRIDAELGMKNNDIVYVEVIEDENTPSLIIDKLLEMENMINIYFNKPETSFMYDQLVEVDKRGTILDVKKKISEIIGVPCDQFRLCHKVSKLPLTNEQLPIKDSKDVFDYCQLYVEIGDSLKQDEILLNVSLFEYLDPNMISEIEKQIPQIPQAEAATEGAIGPMTEEQATVSTVSTNSDSDKAVQDVSSGKAGPEEKKKAEDEAQKEQMENLMKIVLIRKGQFRDLGKLIVREDMTVSELKQLIKETYFMDDIYLDSTLMRVRVRQLLSLGKIFKNDSATLKEAFPELTSGKSIVVQKLTHPEKFAENDMIVYVQRWLPSQWEFTHGSMRKFEVVINREHTKNAQVLKQTIYDAVKTELFPETLQPNSEFNVQTHLGVSKAPTNFEIWYKKECAEVALLNWNSLLDRKTKEPLPNVFGPPLCTVEDDLFIIRDMREPEKFDLDELKSKVSSGSGERALTIKVYNKKDEEEEKRRKEEEEQKQKEQQQQAEPASGKEDRNEQPLSKKQKTTSPDT